MLTLAQQVGLSVIFIAVWAILVVGYARGDVTCACKDRKDLSQTFALITLPFCALTLYVSIKSSLSFITSVVFGMFLSFLIYLIVQSLIPCKDP